MSLYARLALLAVAVAAVFALGWKIHHSGYEAGRAEVRAEWSAQSAVQMQAAMDEAQANARETLRRLERQEENQRVHDQALADARRDAARAVAAADRLREQNASTARQWRDALRDSPAPSVVEAAGAAIGVQADVQRRLVEAGGELAAFATAARAAGLKCTQDYQALTPREVTP